MLLPLSSHSILYNPGPVTDSTELVLYPGDKNTRISEPCSNSARQPPPPAPEDAPKGSFSSYSSCFKTPFVIYLAWFPKFLMPSDIGTAAPEQLRAERRAAGQGEEQGWMAGASPGALAKWRLHSAGTAQETRQWVLTSPRKAFLSKSSVWSRARSARISLPSLVLCSMGFWSSLLSAESGKNGSAAAVWTSTKLSGGGRVKKGVPVPTSISVKTSEKSFPYRKGAQRFLPFQPNAGHMKLELKFNLFR